MLRRIIRRAIEGDGDHVQTALGEFPLHLLRRDVVLGENLRILRQTKPDKAGIVHHVKDVGKAASREMSSTNWSPAPT